MDVTFSESRYFWVGVIFPVLIGLFLRNGGQRRKLLRQLVAARLEGRLAGSLSVAKRVGRFVCMLMGLGLVVVALAGPRWGYTWEKSQRRGRDVLLAIDCSKSMLATDLAPSRLGRAKLAAEDLIGQLEGDRAGLIAFAGTAFLQAPLTVDYGAVLGSLAELDTEIIPRGGTNITAAIQLAVEAFGKGERENRALILFTDGEELDDDAVKAAEGLQGAVRIFTVGVGSADGALIPVAGANGGTEFVKDEKGEFVKSKLDEERLKKIAEVTGGFYIRLQSGPSDTLQIVREGLAQMKEKDIDAKVARRPIERYQWPLGAGLFFLGLWSLIGERKGGGGVRMRMTGLVLGVSLGMIFPGNGWGKNTGVEAYEKADYKGAGEIFKKQLERMPSSEKLHFNSGAAAYKQGEYGKALESFAKAVTSSDPVLRSAAEYNLGNTLYRRGAAQKEKVSKIKEWKSAVEHYDQALNVAPKSGEAKYNRDLVQRMIEDLEKEEKKEEDKKKEEKKPEEKKSEEKKNEENPQSKEGKDPNEEKKNSADQQKSEEEKKSEGKKDGENGEQKPGDGGMPKDGEGKEGKGKDEQSKTGEGKDEGKQKPKDEGNKKGGEGKPEGGEAKDDPSGKGGEKEQPGKPAEVGPEKKREGEIKGQNPQPAGPSGEAEAEAAEAAAAAEGKMTEAQAKGLLESLKGEDSRVQLLKPGSGKAGGRVLKDW